MLTMATIIVGMGIVAIVAAAVVARIADGMPRAKQEQSQPPKQLEPASDHPLPPLP